MSLKSHSALPRRIDARFFGASWRIALITFHVALLAGRLIDGSILEPSVLAHWSGGLALILTALLFQRFAPLRLRGRRALIVFWLLAAFLHLYGPLDLAAHHLDLELTLGLAIPLLAFAILLAAAPLVASSAGRIFEQQSLLIHRSPALSPAAPRGPPMRVF